MKNEIENDVYICAMNGYSIKSVSIVEESIADKCIRQLRSRDHNIRVFRDREKYLEFLKSREMDEERLYEDFMLYDYMEE